MLVCRHKWPRICQLFRPQAADIKFSDDFVVRELAVTRSNLVFAAMLLIMGAPSFTLAQSGLNGISRSVQVLDKNFDIADKNRDGKLSKQEALSGPVPFIARNFDAIDVTHTGFVTKADVHAFIERMLMRSQPANSSSS